MKQLEKAKEKMRETGGKGATYELIAESLYSIAISLDEKNKFDRETRAKDDERMDESYEQSERMVKKVEELQEAQREGNMKDKKSLKFAKALKKQIKEECNERWREKGEACEPCHYLVDDVCYVSLVLDIEYAYMIQCMEEM